MQRAKREQKGFTLLEILLVIAAIGILAAIVIIAINPTRQISQARNAVRQSDINTIQKALEQYLIDNKAYPTSISTTPRYICNTASLQTEGPACTGFVDLKVLVPNYIAAIPRDPQATGDSTGYNIVINPNNNRVSVSADLAERKLISINPHIVTSGLVLNLDAGNTASYTAPGSTWNDLSGNGNNGTLVNGVGYNPANGGSLVFDGVDDYVQKSSATINLSAGVTMEMLFKSTDMNSRAQGFMQYNNGNYINFYTGGNGLLRWETWCAGFTGGGSFFTPTSLSNNTWYHVVGTFVNGSSVLYINGVSVASASQTPGTYSSSYTGNIVIGEYAGYMSGSVGIVRIYNRALLAAEVAQNFNALRGRYGL
jgi:prepilin-type N-terminal cleavage/methylation domain-containing protein